MRLDDAKRFRMPRLGPLAVCMASCYSSLTAAGDASPLHLAIVDLVEPKVAVTNCDDAGAGSLREVVANAPDGSTVDLTATGCSEITLKSGEIHVIQSDLSIVGPGSGGLVIKGGASLGYYNRIFDHSHAGTLLIGRLTLADAHLIGDDSHPASGGCVYSFGTVKLVEAVVTGCTAEAPAGSHIAALGGAIYSRSGVQVVGGSVSANAATSAAHQAYGGGVFTAGAFSTKYTSIADNSASASTEPSGGGGVAVIGSEPIVIVGSTIAHNIAGRAGGLLANTSGTSELRNSTISDNGASDAIGGASFLSQYGVKVSNSTITENLSQSPSPAVGLYVAHTLTAQSSIFANNVSVSGTMALDVGASLIEGNDNVIVSASSAVPTATVVACPRLQKLADNGGPTLTHRANSGSPAIDVGNNHGDFAQDQRSTGFARVYGPAADIGSVEWQGEIDEIVFRSAFEVPCDPYD
jgi:hypothetical protein